MGGGAVAPGRPGVGDEWSRDLDPVAVGDRRSRARGLPEDRKADEAGLDPRALDRACRGHGVGDGRSRGQVDLD
jgi:hypothetical protein